MRVEREEHKMWTTWMQAKAQVEARLKQDPSIKDDPLLKEIGVLYGDSYPPPVIGRWHYHYYSDDGKKHISLVELLDYMQPWREGKGPEWEICSGGTCSNCVDAEERFDSKEEAEVRIKELFGEK